VSPRFRGLHALRRYPNGEERCHRLQARARPPAPALAASPSRQSPRRRLAPRHPQRATTTRPVSSASTAGSARSRRGSSVRPVDSIVETRIYEYARSSGARMPSDGRTQLLR